MAAARFAADSGLKPTTPGLPVVKDDGGKLVERNTWGPANCNGLSNPRSFDYLDCGTPVPTGSKAKNWPVIYAITSDNALMMRSAASPPRVSVRFPRAAQQPWLHGTQNESLL